MKYQKLHRLEKELLPGERFHLEREMEKNVKVNFVIIISIRQDVEIDITTYFRVTGASVRS